MEFDGRTKNRLNVKSNRGIEESIRISLKTSDDCFTDGKTLHRTWVISYKLTAIKIVGLDNLSVVTTQP